VSAELLNPMNVAISNDTVIVRQQSLSTCSGALTALKNVIYHTQFLQRLISDAPNDEKEVLTKIYLRLEEITQAPKVQPTLALLEDFYKCATYQ